MEAATVQESTKDRAIDDFPLDSAKQALLGTGSMHITLQLYVSAANTWTLIDELDALKQGVSQIGVKCSIAYTLTVTVLLSHTS